MTEQSMTIKEMQARFAGEWILVADPQTNEALEVLKGKVLQHGPDRDEVYRQAVTRRPKRCAILYTGELPQDTAVVL